MLNKMPLVPLQMLVDKLDEKALNNLLDASAESQLEENLICIARQKTMVCPYCASRAGFENVDGYIESTGAGWHRARRTAADNAKFVRFHHEFNFFRQFELECTGDKNYERRWGYDGMYKIVSKTTDVTKYSKISFMGEEKSSEKWWGGDFVNALKEIKNGEENVKKFYKSRLENIYLGGKFDGKPVKPVMQLFTRENLLIHIREYHFSERVQEARKKNPYKWYNSVAREGEVIVVPDEF